MFYSVQTIHFRWANIIPANSSSPLKNGHMTQRYESNCCFTLKDTFVVTRIILMSTHVCLDVSKYWSNDEAVSVEEEEDVPQAKRLKLDSAGEPAVEVV